MVQIQTDRFSPENILSITDERKFTIITHLSDD